MSTVQSNNLEKLVTLKTASEKLGVTIETLLSWNEHNILKPTITQTGEVGYAQNQIDQFLIIRQLTQTTSQTQVQPLASPENNEYVPSHIATPIVPKTKSINRRSYRLLVSFAAFALLLTIGLVTQPQGFKQLLGQEENTPQVLAIKTSKLKLPGEIIAALPIEIGSDVTTKKTLHDEGETVTHEKISAPALYKVKTESTIAITNRQNPAPVMTTMHGQTDGATTYASAGVFKDTCSSCVADKDSAIDERGNIRGDSKTNTIATILGGMGGVVDSETLKPASTDATNQLLFFFIGAIAVVYITQQQFAYSRNKPHTNESDAYKNRDALRLQKVLEVEQKTDGTVVLYFQGREYKVSKPELYSESDRFIEGLMALVQPDMKEIEYDMENSKFITPLSRLVTRLGFVGTKRDLFFPRTSKNRVLFRKYLTMQDLTDMNLTTEQVLNDLTMAS